MSGAASLALAMPALAVRAVTSAPGFRPLGHGLGDDLALAEGYSADVLIRWGDGLDGSDAPAFPLNASRQAKRFGFNNDFIAYIPLEGSTRGLLCVNHEYPTSHLMYPGYRTVEEAKRRASRGQTRSEMASVGHSVIEVERTDKAWRVVENSRYARRVHTLTSVALDGPAAGDARLRTSADTAGRAVSGILGCCSGGKTPWGTVLIAEENVGDFFKGKSANTLLQADENEVFQRWGDTDPRFDLGKEPNELNRFGWVVELDPHSRKSTPVKHTSLGRFEHEGATVAHRAGAPIVVYSGDDSEGEFIYRYVSRGSYEPDEGRKNSKLLADGTLYCARFSDSGSGRWLPMRHGEGPLTADNGFADQAAVLIDARRAAALLGATPMDRPEGIAISPGSGRVYVALTKNKKKSAVNEANPRVRNAAGHILEIIPPVDAQGALHWRDEFSWDLLLQGGDPKAEGDSRGVYGAAPGAGAWLANPDNLVFDKRNRLWIATDGMESFEAADGLWCTPIDGAKRAVPRLFLRCPRGAELCGPEFTPDGETLFVALQHPADEGGSHFADPSTRWPDFREGTPPRPSVVAITRDGGGAIGD